MMKQKINWNLLILCVSNINIFIYYLIKMFEDDYLLKSINGKAQQLKHAIAALQEN